MTSEIADLAVLPMEKRRATVYNGLANSVAADTSNPEAAWQLIKFLGTYKAQLISAEDGVSPFRRYLYIILPLLTPSFFCCYYQHYKRA